MFQIEIIIIKYYLELNLRFVCVCSAKKRVLSSIRLGLAEVGFFQIEHKL
jgi:hypothetical protein